MDAQGPRGKEKNSHHIYTVDAFDGGLAMGLHVLPENENPLEEFSLRLPGEQQVVRLRSRYMIDKRTPCSELEKQLLRLSHQGNLRQSTIVLGVNNDPFHPFEGRFDASMKFLSLFERYTPGLLCIQTRSPLLVLALPVLKRLGKHCVVHFGIETPLEEMVRCYTPQLPRVGERLKAIRSLARFGIPVRAQVSPVLPYGDWERDACSFAEQLVEDVSGIDIRGLSDGSEQREQQLRKTPIAQKLAREGHYHWLDPNADRPLRCAIDEMAPHLLEAPKWDHLQDPQLGMFAA
jgi:DNA repair photolyase